MRRLESLTHCAKHGAFPFEKAVTASLLALTTIQRQSPLLHRSTIIELFDSPVQSGVTGGVLPLPIQQR